VKGTTYTCIFIRNEMQQILALLQKMDALVTDGTSCMTGRNSGVFVLSSNDVCKTAKNGECCSTS
jgi:hypothetical protein